MIKSIFEKNPKPIKSEYLDNDDVPVLGRRSSSRFNGESHRQRDDVHTSTMMEYRENLDKQISQKSRPRSDRKRQRMSSQLNGKLKI
jgi:hypothetical protein